ncbi:5342_t:CDS:1 [Paraglomus brasilianum]|uniref:5342_t:CDS:1 n=1 Tax=Paraglomus brasilianum TaxID=144538 RepID=A0A9N9AB36_9GLOM|nr:5342_t:CDS:1 [Paraglomus brasilianum]
MDVQVECPPHRCRNIAICYGLRQWMRPGDKLPFLEFEPSDKTWTLSGATSSILQEITYIETVEDFFRGAPDLGWPDYLSYLDKQQKLLEQHNEPDRIQSRRARELPASICIQRRVSSMEISLRAL